MTRMITAMFDSRSEADTAVDRLVRDIGLARASVQIHGGEAVSSGMAGTGTTSSAASPSGDVGFWSALRDLFVPEDERPTYSEGLRRGSFVVTAEVPDNDLERAMDVLEANGAVDLDSREAQWRSSGWTGAERAASEGGAVASLPTSPEVGVAGTTREPVVERPGGAGGDFTTNPAPGMMDSGPDTSRRTRESGMATSSGAGSAGTGSSAGATVAGAAMGRGMAQSSGPSGTARSMSSETGVASGSSMGKGSIAGTGRDEVIPVVEERIRIGKRDVERGRVRVRSYIVEQPVSEQVTLHSEHVEVQRRKVDRPANATDDMFRERTIEAVERGEEAVVAKEARVTEEVVLRKDSSDRTETVKDTVRHTEVRVEDDTTRKAGGTSANAPSTSAPSTSAPSGTLGTRHASSTSSPPDGTPGNPRGTMASRGVDKALGTNISGANANDKGTTTKR